MSADQPEERLTVTYTRTKTGVVFRGRKGTYWLRPDDGTTVIDLTDAEVELARQTRRAKVGDLGVTRLDGEDLRAEVVSVLKDGRLLVETQRGDRLELLPGDFQVLPEEGS